MSEHSKLFSPSAAKRWMACPASAQAILDSGVENISSVYAKRGTLQHEYVEEIDLGIRDAIVADKPAELSPDEWDDVIIANTAINEVLDNAGIAKEWTETRVGLNAPYDDCFGTVDKLVWDEKNRTMYVLDYKFGYKTVEATMNPQLLIYAVAAMFTLKLNPKTIMLGIIQPKASKFASLFSLSDKELLDFYIKTLTPVMDDILTGRTSFTIGRHCSEAYCPLQGRCAAQEKDIMGALSEYFEDEEHTQLPVIDSALDLKKILELADIVEPWFNAARERVRDTLLGGTPVEGYKLVSGRSNRKWKDEKEAETFLKGQRLKDSERFSRKLISPSHAEKVLRDKLKKSSRTKNRFGELVIKPTGALTVAREDSKKSAVEVENAQETIDELYGDLI